MRTRLGPKRSTSQPAPRSLTALTSPRTTVAAKADRTAMCNVSCAYVVR